MGREVTSPTVGIVSTIKAPEHQVRDFIEYYLKNGISKLYLFFSDPKDPALNLYSNDSRVLSIACNREYLENQKKGKFHNLDTSILIYRQRINANHALELARNDCVTWLCHIDIDEIIYPIKRLHSLLARTRFNSIRFTVLEAMPETLSSPANFSNISLFKKPASIYFPTMLRFPINSLKFNIAKILGLKHFSEFNNDFFRGHLKSKMCFKTNLPIREVRIHQPIYNKSIWTHRTRNIFLLHYEGTDYLKWIEKWQNRIDSTEISNVYRPSTFKMLQKLTDLSSQKPTEEEYISLYRKIYFLHQDDLRLLKFFRLIRRFNPFADISN